MKQESALVKIAKALEGFPAYIAGFIISTFISALTDPIVTALTIGSVAVGFETNAVIAVAVFFLVYTTMRMILAIATSIGVGGQQISYTLAQGMANNSAPIQQSNE